MADDLLCVNLHTKKSISAFRARQEETCGIATSCISRTAGENVRLETFLFSEHGDVGLFLFPNLGGHSDRISGAIAPCSTVHIDTPHPPPILPRHTLAAYNLQPGTQRTPTH